MAASEAAGSTAAVNEKAASVDPHEDDGLGAALLARFVKGVNDDGWLVLGLGSAESWGIGGTLARKIGDCDPKRLVVLVAERSGGR